MTKWDRFFEEKIRIIARSKNILDIGGGFRFQKGLEKYKKLFENSNYIVLDIESSYRPDIVGDVHNLPQQSESVDAVICKAVLEHVYNPHKAVDEIYRILKKSGKCLVYVPFLYPYHGQKEGYNDYYRYTDDGIRYLFRKFSSIEICPVRGNLETVLNLTPFRNIAFLNGILRYFDKKLSYKQVSGYNIFVIK
jgi:SAM-dependent methyltransferase